MCPLKDYNIRLPNNKDVQKAIELLNSEKIKLHTKGRATNIKSITTDEIKNY